MKILLIDDDVLEHKMFKCYLDYSQLSGVEFHHASDIGAAMDLLRSIPFDWIFLDDRFTPHKSVLETLPLLRPHVGLAQIVVISSSVLARHLRSARALGVHAVVDKFNVKTFLGNGLRSLPQTARKQASFGREMSRA